MVELETQGIDSDEQDAWDNAGYSSEEDLNEGIRMMRGYEVLNVTKIRDTMMEFLKELNEMFSLDDNDLMKLAKHFKWNKQKMTEGWLMSEDKQKKLMI